MTTQSVPFIISRTFAAPLAQVWRAWTEGERLQKWFGPKGCTLLESTMDLRVGGVYHYGMQMGSDRYWGRWVFREIAPRTRMVFVVSFADEKGAITRNPWNQVWPLETLSTVTFEEQRGSTLVTVRWEPINATLEEEKAFADGHASMQGGWGGTLDRLVEYLPTA